jgi:OOP family OmpA-OmpF porin
MMTKLNIDLPSLVKAAALGLCIVALTACGRVALQSARDTAPEEASAFGAALYEGYLERAEHEAAEWDLANSDIFAGKAETAALGRYVPPFALGDWDIPEDNMGELAHARKRLVQALGQGARDIVPEETALAQVMFDCWVEEQSENTQPDDIAACRDGFYDAMAAVEAALVPEPEPEPAPPMVEPEPLMPASYLVFFDWDSAALTYEAKQIVAAAAANALRAGYSRVEVTGHADRSGPDGYNMGLSMHRAEAVQAGLAAQGLMADGIATLGRGERDPLVSTADGVREPQNRRAEIVLRP